MDAGILKEAQEHYPPSAGKFEGESLDTIYYYFGMMDGWGDVIEVDDDERLEFGLSYQDRFAVPLVDSQGFVSCEYYESEESAEARVSEFYPDETIRE